MTDTVLKKLALWKSRKLKNASLFLHPDMPYFFISTSIFRDFLRHYKSCGSFRDSVSFISSKYDVPQRVVQRDMKNVIGNIGKLGVMKERLRLNNKHTEKITGLFLHLTSRCNLACPHCYRGGHNGKKSDLSVKIVKKAINELSEVNGSTLVLSGGEPLLYKGFKDILKESAGRVNNVKILTNGTLLDKDTAKIIADTGAHIQISLDGASEKTNDIVRGKGSYRKVLNGIGHLKNVDAVSRCNLSFTIMNHNTGEVDDMIDFARRHGIPSVRFLVLRKEGCAVSNWNKIGRGIPMKKYEEIFKRLFDISGNISACADRRTKGEGGGLTASASGGQAGRSAVKVNVEGGLSGFNVSFSDDEAVNPLLCPVGQSPALDLEGKVYPCVLLMRKEFLMGDLRKEGLQDINARHEVSKIRRICTDRKDKISKCRKCVWNNFCQSACAGLAYECCGTILDTDNLCGVRKILYIRVFNEMVRKASC